MKSHTGVRILSALLVLASAGWAADRRSNRYVLVLETPPVAQAVASRTELGSAVARSRERAITAEQDRVRAALGERNIAVLGSAKVVANAIFVRASAEQASALGRLKGVARVERDRPLKLKLDKALDLVNVPAAWSVLGGSGSAGAGVKIGILDTGIDITHPGFADTGFSLPAGFPKVNSDSDRAYTNNKVIVARSYVSGLVDAAEPAYSRPDDLSARDRVGHGTAMAMIAAGGPAAGPRANITGVAPKAWLGNYKIYGSPGVNDYTFTSVLTQALDDAVSDGMDVITLALGGAALWGPTDSGSTCGLAAGQSCDTWVGAVQSATSLGLTVVVSGGNSGLATTVLPPLGTIESPGTAPSVITVGATTNAHTMVQTLSVTGANAPSNLQAVNALFGNGPRPATPLSAPLRDVATLGDSGTACSPLASGSLAGAIGLILRGGCALDVKVIQAQTAGAVAVVIYQFSGVDYLDGLGGLDQTAIPAVEIGNTDGVALKAYLASNPGQSVTLDPTVVAVNNSYSDEVTLFSSEGPSIGTLAIKPELAAVGADLYTATQSYDPNSELYDKSGFTGAQGSSFATGLVAGAVALVKQRNRGFTPGQLKSAVVNTANAQNLTDYDMNGPFSARATGVGAGKLDAGAAVQTNVTVEPATLSFGDVSKSLGSIALKLTNTSTATLSLSLSVQARDVDANAQVSVSPASVSVGAGQAAVVTARLQGRTPNAGSYEGAVVISGGAVPLRVPYLYLVGDGVAYNIFPIEGFDFVGNAGELVPGGGYIGFRLLDQYGVPVPNAAVQFRVTAGGGSITAGNATTDSLGIAEASGVYLGTQVGYQEFSGTAGVQTVYFSGRTRTPPTISSGGIVNAGSQRAENGIAPGSYISIYGAGLSEAVRSYTTSYLPLSLATVSVSFDTGSSSQPISLPGRIWYVSPTLVNLQVPWELAGQSSAQVKVSLGDFSTPLVTVPVTTYSPAFFEYTDPTGPLVIVAQDVNYGLVGSANPVKRGQVVLLYANGLGPVTNPPASGEPASSTTLSYCQKTPSVTIGGRVATVSFCGLVPTVVGLYLVSAVVPADAPAGLDQVVMVQQGVTAKTSNLMVQ